MGVAQVVDACLASLEFKPQYHQKKRKEHIHNISEKLFFFFEVLEFQFRASQLLARSSTT
jgi:hypothetical protein